VNKGLIFDIHRFTVHDGPGIRTTVFFKGCPMRCWWCHNPESQDFKPETSIRNLILSGKKFRRSETTGKLMTAGEVFHEIERDRIFYDESGGGVTFSGGEPLMQKAFLLELLKMCRKADIHTSLDTSGYASNDEIRHIAKWTDLFLYDIKLMDDALHRKYTGVSNRPVLKNLQYLIKSGNKVILRFPVIPGITDTPENIRLLKDFITTLQRELPSDRSGHQYPDSPLEIDLLPYHSTGKGKYSRFNKPYKLQALPSLTVAGSEPIKNEFETLGIRVKTGG